MIVKINGVVVEDTLLDKIQKATEDAKEKLGELNRETRRSHHYKKLIGLVTFLGVIGASSVAKAESLDSSISTSTPLSGTIMDFVFQKMTDHLPQAVDIAKEDSVMWQLNNYVTNTLFHTQNFFTDPTILGIFHTIWTITLSLTMLMVGKKGFDMVKARVIGGHSQGATEFIIRLLASGLMTFLSLSILGMGIDFSNIVTSLFMKKMSTGIMHFTSPLQLAEGGIGALFWMVGFVIMFLLLGVRYWSRQINTIFLGCVIPVANMAWVTDGGALLGTLIKELMLCITTPIVQTLVLGIGTVVLNFAGTSGQFGFINSMLIGLSTMIMMFTTPDFLRRLTTGSFNPFKAGLDMFLRMKSLPLSILKAVK